MVGRPLRSSSGSIKLNWGIVVGVDVCGRLEYLGRRSCATLGGTITGVRGWCGGR